MKVRRYGRRGTSRRKPQLTVLLGAGASVELGVPTTSDLKDVAIAALLRSPAFVSEDCPVGIDAVVSRLLARCEAYYGPTYTFEHLLHVLEAVDTLAGSLQGEPNPRRAVEPMFSNGIHPDAEMALDRYFAPSAQTAMVGAIREAVRVAAVSAERHARWSTFATFWTELDQTFDLRLATLNYDSLVTTALSLGPSDQGFVPVRGESTWRFNERVLRERPKMMHLHGSIHFGYRDHRAEPNRFAFEDGWDDLYWHRDPVLAARQGGARSNSDSQAGRSTTRGALISGLDKTDKLLAEPYGSYMRAFGDVLRGSPRLLVIGYGYGDLHINALIRRMGRLHGDRRRIANLTHFDPMVMHGAWGSLRNEEATLLHMWSEDLQLLRPLRYESPLQARTGMVEVYYQGLMAVAETQPDRLKSFLLS